MQDLTLRFTAHCQVRYIERFLDKDAVVQARREHNRDVQILNALEPQFAQELKRFRHIMQVAYYGTMYRTGDFVESTPFFLNVGTLSIRIDGNLVKTTINKHRDHRPRGPFGAHPDGGNRPACLSPDSEDEAA
ncbi:MAG: hypothetical protein GIW99_12420 [Candidatus Eremiobacteraeota bacterium]|nr:hypothetical protein [Candidatus Eremiobacteraeota bacterium]MBC5828462.1 hypothetical protein [Candidatus Eremiobacteraeota bacterium]